ncbi:MAG: outer membrane protein assembly factor BamD [Bacteroidota bacterium]
MNQRYTWSLLLGLLFFLGACRSEFEKIRTNPDPAFLQKKAFEYYEAEDYQKAQTLFELIINSLRGQADAEKVYFAYAYCHYHQEKYVLASYYFKNFVSTYGNSAYKEEAEFMSAYSHYQLSPIYRLEQSYSEKAIDGFQLFVNTYPKSERVKQANQLIDEMRKKMEKKSLAEGQLYYNIRQYQSATRVFENVLKDYPDSKDAERVRYLIVKAHYLLAENSVYEKQEERLEATVDKADAFMEKYSKSEYTDEIKKFKANSNKSLKKFKDVRHKNKSSRA